MSVTFYIASDGQAIDQLPELNMANANAARILSSCLGLKDDDLYFGRLSLSDCVSIANSLINWPELLAMPSSEETGTSGVRIIDCGLQVYQLERYGKLFVRFASILATEGTGKWYLAYN